MIVKGDSLAPQEGWIIVSAKGTPSQRLEVLRYESYADYESWEVYKSTSRRLGSKMTNEEYEAERREFLSNEKVWEKYLANCEATGHKPIKRPLS